MVEAAAANGWIDRDAAVLETLTSIRRAGADVILTYWAADAARLLAAAESALTESAQCGGRVRAAASAGAVRAVGELVRRPGRAGCSTHALRRVHWAVAWAKVSVWSSGVTLVVGSGGSVVGTRQRGQLGRCRWSVSASVSAWGSASGWASASRWAWTSASAWPSRSACSLPPRTTALPRPLPPVRAGAARRAGGVGQEDAGRGRAVGHRGEVAVHVGLHDRDDQVDVVVGVVVAVDAGALALVGGQVVVTGAEVDGRGERRVVDVLRVALAVVVAVDADDRPGRRDELHRADGAVELGVGVVLTGVGVDDVLGVVLAVERDAVDAGLRHAVVAERVAAEAAVVGLDPADGRDQLPRDLAGLVGGVDDGLGALVGDERGRRDAAGGGGGDDLAGVAGRGGGGDGGGGGDAGRGLDRLRRDGAAVGQGRGRVVGGRRSRRRCRSGWRSTRPRARRAARWRSLCAVE